MFPFTRAASPLSSNIFARPRRLLIGWEKSTRATMSPELLYPSRILILTSSADFEAVMWICEKVGKGEWRVWSFVNLKEKESKLKLPFLTKKKKKVLTTGNIVWICSQQKWKFTVTVPNILRTQYYLGVIFFNVTNNKDL